MPNAAFALSLVFPVAMLWAMASDAARFEIPNRIPLALAALYPVWALLAGAPAPAFLWHALAGAAVLVAGALLFFARVLGGGDAKLIAAAALWVGPAGLPRFLLATALLGGVLALGLVLFRLLPEPAWASEGGWLRRLHRRRREAPYAIAIGGAGLAWYAAAAPLAG